MAMDHQSDDRTKGSKMKHSEHFFETILKNCPALFYVLDSRFQVVMCNKSTYTNFGFKTEKEYLDNFKKLSPQAQPDGESSEKKFMEYAAQAYENGKKEFEWMHCNHKGNPKAFQVTLMRIDVADSHGGNYLVCFLDDMQKRIKEREQEIQFKTKMKAVLDATPLCLNLWNEKKENIMCNKKAPELFGLSSEEEYLEHFHELSPAYQPNGKPSKEYAMEKIQKAFETGFSRFNWLHWNLEGEEIPAEITLAKIDGVDNDGQNLVAGFTRDLRQQLAGNAERETFEDYFFNYISDKMLFKAVVELSDELFFALDIRTSLIQYYGKRRAAFGFGSEHYRFPEEIIEADLIYPDDIPTFRKLSENMKKGEYEPLDMRFVFKDGTWRYYEVEYQTLYNRKNEPVFSIGKAVDINEKKELEIRSTVDSLTDCLNKATTKKCIEDLLGLEKDGNHALFIVDIDDFKSVNDTLGHHFGDLVLGEIAKHLKSCFRKQDIIGRIGGDEFIIFVSNVQDKNVLIRQAEKMIEGFHTIYSSENQTYKISGSIGIACYPQDGMNYEELYKAADKALYQSKGSGKDGYTFYKEDFSKRGIGNITVVENASKLANAYYDASMVSSVFNLLYETTDIKATINTVLQLLGEQIELDRCYVLETDDFGETYHNTYEWCSDKALSEIKERQGLPRQLLEPFFEMANRDGIAYSSDCSAISDPDVSKIMEGNGVKAFLHVHIMEKNYIKLVLGVDNCRRGRKWNEKEINNMLHIARLLATFLK